MPKVGNCGKKVGVKKIGVKNLSDGDREAILQTLLSNVELLKKPKSRCVIYKDIAAGFGVVDRTIRRIWKSATEQGVLVGNVNICIKNRMNTPGGSSSGQKQTYLQGLHLFRWCTARLFGRWRPNQGFPGPPSTII